MPYKTRPTVMDMKIVRSASIVYSALFHFAELSAFMLCEDNSNIKMNHRNACANGSVDAQKLSSQPLF